ncbi:beta-ketoacyl-[acyl-carrier-protein] synthase III [Frondihabitans sucicola]|uniref:Beta-ketoacyl-[acyl-carrier-protein] synthase III n=1 Tax=Frondihabitans sucicola TaxID=1268041 RepID=A0ABM8GPI6_9MICO|nr:beta-ketoacyl-ACP synthase III [Frondihabitans sucicola]BDZ50363.1 beta-ketoacyl-[acyl-carrier-protein] synthase III [Frondihabitans sucicola]
MSPTLRSAEPSTFSRILAVGGVRGEYVVPNDDLVGPIDSSDEWIQRRTGIVSRRRASQGVLVQDLAEGAGRSAVEAAGVDPALIDVVIISTVSWMQPTPGMAPIVANRIGASPSAAAYDVNAGCAGYCYGIGQADGMIRSGLAKYVLVIGAEKLSDYADPTDRSISFIIGDGAGAALVGPSDVPGIGPTIWGSDGSHSDAITMTHTWLDYKNASPDEKIDWPTARQEGPSVYRWAVTEMPKMAARAIEAAGLRPEDIDVFIPHQANLRIVDGMAQKLGLRDDVVIATDIVDTGNTSGASVPLATERLLREGRAHGGQIALQFGFGAGLAYAAQVVLLPDAVGAEQTLTAADVAAAAAAAGATTDEAAE